ncbi:MAG: glucose-6-phosphate dehydrogenase assembly protein OpcA [Deltaproteobacteria bacterium]|nr:glucose-6-phosphate dehydrogenase assembly protein OpcA [Deltaproteobacteria bacterium]
MKTREVVLARDVGVDVGGIERELGALWRDASKRSRHHGQVTRACSWNLVVHCADDATYSAVRPMIDQAVRFVPSRTLLLKPRPNAPVADGKAVEAWVTAACQVATGGGKLLCTEEITIESRGPEGVAHLPGLVRALTVPDVPTALLWAGAPPTSSAALRILLAGVDRLVFDTQALPEGVEGGLAKLAHLGGLLDGLALADLAWLRTASLRSVIASLFDEPIGSAPLDRLKRVRLRSTPRGVPAAKLLVGWLASRLGWGTPERAARGQLGWQLKIGTGSTLRIDIDVDRVTSSRECHLHSVVLETAQGEHFAVTDAGAPALEVSVPGLASRSVLAHEPTAPQALVAALGARGRDRLYPVALHRAVELDR